MPDHSLKPTTPVLNLIAAQESVSPAAVGSASQPSMYHIERTRRSAVEEILPWALAIIGVVLAGGVYLQSARHDVPEGIDWRNSPE